MADSRYIRDIRLSVSDDEVEALADNFISSFGFYKDEWRGEECYAADYRPRGVNSNISGYKRFYFFKYRYEDGIFHLEAWLREGKDKESDLRGFVNLMMKQPYLEKILDLERKLIELLPADSQLRAQNTKDADVVAKEIRGQRVGRIFVYIASVAIFAWAFFSVIMYIWS